MPPVQASQRTLLAYVLPFGAFLAFLGLSSLLSGFFESSTNQLLVHPEFWIYPLQTVVCAGILIYYWKEYTFAPLWPWFIGVGVGLLVLAIWVSPQAVFHFKPRLDGFNPQVFQDSPLLYNLTVISRFARLVIVVPLLEEIFWRGFLMRYLISDNFARVPFGKFSAISFFGVAVLFMFEHGTPDWPAALITGLLYNALAVRTKSLFACVVAHAVTNLGLGLYIMRTGQWGFW